MELHTLKEILHADAPIEVGATPGRIIKHIRSVKDGDGGFLDGLWSDGTCTPATVYPGIGIPTQCVVRSSLHQHDNVKDLNISCCACVH